MLKMKIEESNFIAVDIGAGSGRVILGTLKNDMIQLKEIHRFENHFIKENTHICWNLNYLFSELVKGLTKIGEKHIKNILGIGIDTWGVDYALFDKNDNLLNNPIAYRDSRTNGLMEEVFEIIPKEKIYEKTGIQFMQFNTLFQLYSEIKNVDTNINKAESMLFIPDVFNFLLTGIKKSEYTIASTSQMLNAYKKKWDFEIISSVNIPMKILPEIIFPGNIIGKLKREIRTKTKLDEIEVVAIGSHDTASAVAAVPTVKKNWAYLSSGTWSLIGIEVSQPIINDTSYKNGFTNEGGVNGTIRYLKNTMGLWILEQSIKSWGKNGYKKNYDELFSQAEQSPAFASIINPDDLSFLNPPDMPEAIVNYCKKTNQKIPGTKGEFVRCILESLALKYKHIIEKLNEQLDEKIEILHIVGGGSRNEMLNQFTANAVGIPVITGPVEATATGNILMQAIAKGKIKNIQEGRMIVKNSILLKKYFPQNIENWETAYQTFKNYY